MKCDQCGNEIKDKVFTAVGVHICEDCNKENGGTIDFDLIFNKITKEKDR